jgi:hypothetical protein
VPRQTRRGSAYLAIFGATTLVAVIGFAAVTAARVQLRTTERGGDVQAARAHARSGIELARLWMQREPDWRTRRPSAVWVERQPIDRGGTVTIEVIDPSDNDLANWETDPVVVTATGTSGAATQIERITLVPRRDALTCLDVALLADGAIQINSGTLAFDQTVATNSSFATTGSSRIDCRVEAVGPISGSGYLGSRVTDIPLRSTPDDRSVFDAYPANATWISFNSLAGGAMRDVVLSPQNNPYGPSTNPRGIYAIDCAGRTFVLRDARVVGTLILINPKSDSRIEGAVNVAPAIANFPCLLVRGSIRLEHVGSALMESSGRNFNPPGTPYNGLANNTVTDSYPSQVGGLVYVTGSATLSCQGRVDGPFVCGGALTGQGTLTLGYDSAPALDPPPGFARPAGMEPRPGSAARVVR